MATLLRVPARRTKGDVHGEAVEVNDCKAPRSPRSSACGVEEARRNRELTVEIGSRLSKRRLTEYGVLRRSEGRVGPVEDGRIEDDVEGDGRLPFG